jgi:hypothetical protein
MDVVCPRPKGYRDDAYFACTSKHPDLIRADLDAISREVRARRAISPPVNTLTIDQMEDVWGRADSRSDYNRLSQPHFGYSSGFNPIAP